MNYLVSPVYRSILFPSLVFGMPRRLFIIIGIATLALVFSLGQIWFLAVTFTLMLITRKISKQDRYVFEIYTQLFKTPQELD
jgi:type IV secretory pathway VirB3-like protein